jgi:hypothetical protein
VNWNKNKEKTDTKYWPRFCGSKWRRKKIIKSIFHPFIFRKIEMITSYGNDTLSDSESESEKVNSPSQAKKMKLSHDNPDAKKSKKNAKVSEVMFGPELPQMNYNLSLPPSHIPKTKVNIYSSPMASYVLFLSSRFLLFLFCYKSCVIQGDLFFPHRKWSLFISTVLVQKSRPWNIATKGTGTNEQWPVLL